MDSEISSKFALVCAACVGGILVLVGLWLEIRADKKWFKSLKSRKRWERAKTIGEWLVVVGVFIEVCDAGLSAVNEWKIRQVEIKNDPLNQPISEVSATVGLRLAGPDFIENPPWGSSRKAYMVLCETGQIFGSSSMADFESLNANEGDIYREGVLTSSNKTDGFREYVFHFHLDEWELTAPRATPWRVQRLVNNVKAIKIDAKLIPHDARIMQGHAAVFINGGVRMDFDILPQAPFPYSLGGLGTNPDDCGFTFIATNATFVAIAPDRPF